MTNIRYVRRECRVCGVTYVDVDTICWDHTDAPVIVSTPRTECRNCEGWSGVELLAHHLNTNMRSR